MDNSSLSVNVLMSTYKPNWNYFHQSMKSIQSQTFKNFKVILVNDGVDKKELEENMKMYDFQYEVINNVENLGLTRSLNKGLKQCTAKYIARFDDDDIMEPERLQSQFDYMEANKDVSVAFTNFEVIDNDGNHLSVKTEDDNDEIKQFLLMRGNCLCHSTLFIRKEVIDKLSGYDESMIYAQDYDLYLRLLDKYTFYKLPQPLIKFRQGSCRSSVNKKIMSMSCSYYASIKYLHNHYSFRMFASRTFRFIIGMLRILFARTNG